MRDMRRAMGAAVLLGVLTVAACTSEAPEPAPPLMPTPSASQTPTETPQERQERLDYAAAEKSYRTFRAEYNRVLRAGGAKKPTKVMKATAGGDYLDEFVAVIRAYEGLGSYRTGEEKLIFVRPAGRVSDSMVSLQVCEDGRDINIYNSSKKRVGRGEIRSASLDVKRTTQGWKIWAGEGSKVSSCD